MPELSIASFNTHYGLLARLPRRPIDLERALRALDADVIVLQEVWRPDGVRGAHDEAAEALGLDFHYQPNGTGTGVHRWPRHSRRGEGTIGIAVLTRLPVRRVGSIPLGPTPGDPAPERAALHLELTVDGAPLQLIAVHLTSRLPQGPMLQLRQLARAVPLDSPAVIAGDFNFWGPGVRGFLRRWRRAVRGRTWPARLPHSQIDHVLVCPSIAVRKGAVLPDFGSDHRPVRAELSW